MKHTGSVGLSNVQQSPPQRELGVYRTRDLRSDTTCSESRLPLDQNPQVLVNDRIARDKDPRKAVNSCRKTHGERWFIQCPTGHRGNIQSLNFCVKLSPKRQN